MLPSLKLAPSPPHTPIGPEVAPLMGLAQYSDSFRKEHITGELLLECDEDLLQHELGISSRLHRVRLLRFISGQSSTQTLLEGQ